MPQLGLSSTNNRSTTGSGSTSSGNDPSATAATTTTGGSFLTKYFLVTLFGFACLFLALNNVFTHVAVNDVSIIESVLQNYVQQLSFQTQQQQHPVLDDDHTRNGNGNEYLEAETNVKLEQQQHQEQLTLQQQQQQQPGQTTQRPSNNILQRKNDNGHKISSLNCDAYGGPSQDVAQEMVYWEDIPQDAQYISPFHIKKRGHGSTMSMSQFLTFEPDEGGWNNIRMAMGTLFTIRHSICL
jgi:hypothetical protein